VSKLKSEIALVIGAVIAVANAVIVALQSGASVTAVVLAAVVALAGAFGIRQNVSPVP
jgi:hypothetical protein